MGAFTTHIDDILGCGEGVSMLKAQVYLTRRPGALKPQETTCNHVGVEIAQLGDFSVSVA